MKTATIRAMAVSRRAAAAVVHEHVVAIHNVETQGDVPYLVMQYVPGQSLQSRVDQHGPLAVAEILRIGVQAAAGLAALGSSTLGEPRNALMLVLLARS